MSAQNVEIVRRGYEAIRLDMFAGKADAFAAAGLKGDDSGASTR